jgi:integrase
VAQEWYLDLRGRLRNGQIVKKEKTFGDAAEDYLRQARVLAATVRSPTYAKEMELRMRAHLFPFFGKVPLSEVNRGLVMSYRVKRSEETLIKSQAQAVKSLYREEARLVLRAQSPAEIISIQAEMKERRKVAKGKPPARSTMNQEMVHIRQVLKHAEGMGWLSHLPNLQMPYKSSTKRERRTWFSPEEYKQLYTATGRKASKASARRGWLRRYQALHDLVLFIANTGLRPDEALRLEFRDVAIEKDYATKQTILVIDVRGKTGVGYCKSMPGAVFPFVRTRERREDELRNPSRKKARPSRAKGAGRREMVPVPEPRGLAPTDLVFPEFNRDAFNAILREEGLKHDRDGRVRTLYSLRHTYISMRLMEGADIYQIANNCCTSVQMIEQFYAAHIKDRLDAAAINVERPKAARKAPRQSRENGEAHPPH